VGFELTISAGEQPKTYALDRTATESGYYYGVYIIFVLVPDRTGPKHFAVAFFKHCEKMQYSTVYTHLDYSKTKFLACVHTT
jgi:hypothetical protein